MIKRMIGWLCACVALLAAAAVSGCLHASMGNLH